MRHVDTAQTGRALPSVSFPRGPGQHAGHLEEINDCDSERCPRPTLGGRPTLWSLQTSESVGCLRGTQIPGGSCVPSCPLSMWSCPEETAHLMQARGHVLVPESWLRERQAKLGFSGPRKALIPGMGPGLAPPQAQRLLSPSLAKAVP